MTGIRALDTVLDENLPNHPLKEQREMAEKYRNVGLGIMGLHDALIKLGIKYGSPDSINFVHKIMNDMFVNAVLESSQLAEEKGRFPMYKDELLDSDIIKEHFSEGDLVNCGIRRTGLRNCSLLSIAPTGSLGTMLNISTGCEPLFALYYNRKTESLNGGEDKYYKVYSGVVKEYVEKYGENLPDYFVCSGDINWRDRIVMQAVLQNHVDTAISSTINLPNEIELDEIEKLYLYAWESGLKGVTIFRDGCKRIGILSTGDSTMDSGDADALKRGDVVKADNDCVGLKRTLYTGCGTLHCEAFFDPATGELRETYFSKGSSGGCNNFMIGLSRMISLASRGGVGLDYIVDQLKSSGTCPSYAVRAATKKDTSKGSSCPVAIGNALVSMHDEFLEKYVTKVADKDCKKSETKVIENSTVSGKCPVCGEALVFEGGCNTCKSCGWNKCE